MTERSVAEPSSDDLVRRVRSGETAAFEALIRRHAPDVWKVAEALLDDPVARDNLVQQTFVNAFQRLHQYQIGRDVVLWLRGIARNLVREEIRRRRRERHALGRYYTHVLTVTETDDQAEARQRAVETAIARCRGELAPPAARAIDMFYDRGLSVADVASALGRTPNATRILLFRARLTLRDCLQRRMGSS